MVAPDDACHLPVAFGRGRHRDRAPGRGLQEWWVVRGLSRGDYQTSPGRQSQLIGSVGSNDGEDPVRKTRM